MFRNLASFFILVAYLTGFLAAEENEPIRLSIELQTVLERQEADRDKLWFHPRVGVIPAERAGGSPMAVMTLQKLLGKSDFFSGLSVMTSQDRGKTWHGPETPEPLAWVVDGSVSVAVADVTPGFHNKSGTLLAVGAQVRYSKEGVQLNDLERSHQTAYAVLDREGNWQGWQRLPLPRDAVFNFARSACAQWVEEDDGTVLLPFYVATDKTKPFSSVVIRCSFDGKTLRYLEHGNFLELSVKRGLYEPSLIHHRNHYYLTMRNDEAAYVSSSEDGLTFTAPKKWAFDDGVDLGSYNTQAHWLELGGGLFLAYTRRGADNDHIMRHRAPIFVGRVDLDTLSVVRDSERIVIPERGATLGNFGVVKISEDESWVTAGEGNVTAEAEKRGAKGSVFLARVRAAGSKDSAPSRGSVKFSVMGCGPYTPEAERAFAQYMHLENEIGSSEFIVHVGDIVTGRAKNWGEDQFVKIRDLLQQGNQIPTFIVPGDNEWTDHAEPERAWGWWNKHFLKFEENWDTTTLGSIARQAKRPENFSFTHKGIRFIGINKVGGAVYDEGLMKQILADDGEWVSKQLSEHSETRAAVIFAQASAGGNIRDFVKVLIPAADQYGKPILYVHADLHNWLVEEKKWADNITRLQLETIDQDFPPVEVTVTEGKKPEFVFNRRLEDKAWKVRTLDDENVFWSIGGGGEGDDKIRSISSSPDGGVYVTGESSGDFRFRGHIVESRGGLDFFVAKIDSGGRVLWVHRAGGNKIDRGYAVESMPYGGCVVTGHFESERITFGAIELVNRGDYDGFVARFDKQGECKWAKGFGGAGYDYGHGIDVLKHGDIVVSGAVQGEGLVGSESIGSEEKRSAVLARLDGNGDWEWVSGFEGKSMSGHDVAVSSDYSIYLSGYSLGKVKWSNTRTTESEFQDPFLARFDGKGNLKWVKDWGGQSDGLATSLSVDDVTGNIAAVGHFKREISLAKTSFNSRGGNDFFAAVFSKQGDALGVFQGGGEGTDYGLGVVAGEDGFVATGAISGAAEFGGKTLTATGKQDSWVAQLAVDGSEVGSVRVLGGVDRDLSYAVTKDSDGGVVISGGFRTETVMGSVQHESAGGHDVFVTKLKFPSAAGE